ncbi:LysE family transporter [Glaesserella parasuis]|uniref:LysE family transporter n=1 Tax=Glaesserella parasuis TaxID=738 RepID=UPI0013207576|nr:LysE family transporter [Glaesserella parasuis]MCT8549324.1 LysE family transporter [Glaesserella parasuis]MCT8785618.1 LysE family transporter [Glaesserella parasuis]MCT8787917.1 LysE family transporter [Glaesserella parasuis]MDE4030888.1 LysE family transporter [Glaesserella parasuis]MDG6283983.1 LysE family transporter [Glaesserella parasuis]
MWTIFFVQLLGLISPGPDFFYVSRKAMADTRRNAILGAIGISIGVAFWALLTLFGLAFLNKHFPSFQFVLMICGGSYLAYSGIQMVQITKNAEIGSATSTSQATSTVKEILKGLMINLANPKIVVFFSSVLAGYVANLSALADLLAVLAILVGSAVVYFWLVALLFSRPAIRHFYAKYNRYLDNFAGAVFILFGGKLVYEGVFRLWIFS